MVLLVWALGIILPLNPSKMQAGEQAILSLDEQREAQEAAFLERYRRMVGAHGSGARDNSMIRWALGHSGAGSQDEHHTCAAPVL